MYTHKSSTITLLLRSKAKQYIAVAAIYMIMEMNSLLLGGGAREGPTYTLSGLFSEQRKMPFKLVLSYTNI